MRSECDGDGGPVGRFNDASLFFNLDLAVKFKLASSQHSKQNDTLDRVPYRLQFPTPI